MKVWGWLSRLLVIRRLIKDRAETLAAKFPNDVRLVESEMVVGGGTLPDEYFPSWALELTCGQSSENSSQNSSQTVLKQLRELPLPVIGVIRNNRVQLNLASVLPHDLSILEEQLKTFFA